MEKVIVAAAEVEPKFKSSLIKNSDKVGKKIVSSLRLSGKRVSFPKNSYPASKKWNTYFGPGGAKGSTLTPKTDFIIGRERISLKTGDAQLMSGGQAEASATFYVDRRNIKTIFRQVSKSIR